MFACRWQWPLSTQLPVSRVWTPLMRVVNCDAQGCALHPRNETFVTIHTNGETSLSESFVLRAACEMKLVRRAIRHTLVKHLQHTIDQTYDTTAADDMR